MKYSVYHLRKENRGLFLQETIKSADVYHLFMKAKFPDEVISLPKVVELYIPEALQDEFKECKLEGLDGAYAFISKGTFWDEKQEEFKAHTFVWIPLSKEVRIFDGEPFETDDMPRRCSSIKKKFFLRAKWGEEPTPVYLREFQINRFEIAATADYREEIGFGVGPAEKHGPLYFKEVPYLEE